MSLGLNRDERYHARQRAKRSALLGYYHRGNIHYTQGGRRWDGINERCRAKHGEYPHYADCSSFDTWCLWDATRIHGLPDFVNGYGWRAGFTGTMTQHGAPVTNGHLLVADLVFYGGSYSVPGHVAMYVGGGKVVSHGSEAGPLLLPYGYRPITQIRRYIR